VTEHPNIELTRRGYDAFSKGDLGALSELIADDAIWHVPGVGPLSGTYHGRDEVFTFFGRLAEETAGTFRLDVHDVLANDEHAVALCTLWASRGNKSVADRWHLWHNLAEHTAKAVARHRACLKQIAAAAEQAQPPPEPITAAAAVPAPESQLAARMRDQHTAVQALAARGLGLRAIARELRVDRKTARRFAHAATGDEAVARAISRPTVLDRYQPHLHRRWNEGCHDTAVLHAEITALGYRGSLRTLYRYLQPLRTGTAPTALTPSALKIGEVTSWLLRRADDLNPRQQQLLADVRGHCAQLDRLAEHVTGFAKMMTRRTGQHDLDGWLERADADDQPELHTFAAGIRHDLAAVTAGPSLPYSSGPTEGNVNRLKAIKRQMYGRASLDLLRKRVIHHPP
jgi:ketosteroid isomerase-like protein